MQGWETKMTIWIGAVANRKDLKIESDQSVFSFHFHSFIFISNMIMFSEAQEEFNVQTWRRSVIAQTEKADDKLKMCEISF